MIKRFVSLNCTASFTLTNINTSCPIKSSYITAANKPINKLWANMPKCTSFMLPSDERVGIMILLLAPLWHRQTEETGHVLLVNLLSPPSIPQLQWGCPVKYFSPVRLAHWFFFFPDWGLCELKSLADHSMEISLTVLCIDKSMVLLMVLK